MIDAGSSTRVIDASTAFRTAEGWAYGMPEISKLSPHKIAGRSARRQPRLLSARADRAASAR